MVIPLVLEQPSLHPLEPLLDGLQSRDEMGQMVVRQVADVSRQHSHPRPLAIGEPRGEERSDDGENEGGEVEGQGYLLAIR